MRLFSVPRDDRDWIPACAGMTNPQEALEREQCSEVTVAAHGVEAHGRIRRAEDSDVGLAIPAVEHSGDLGMQKHRLLQIGRVAVRIRDDEDVHAANKVDSSITRNVLHQTCYITNLATTVTRASSIWGQPVKRPIPARAGLTEKAATRLQFSSHCIVVAMMYNTATKR